jgi:hypothetical protein
MQNPSGTSNVVAFPTPKGIDLSLPASILRELEQAVPQAGFRLQVMETNPGVQDNIRFHQVCGISKSRESSAALFYVDDERLQLKAISEPYFVYSLCVRVCKRFKPGERETLSLVLLTPEGTTLPSTWEQQIRDFKAIRAVAAAERIRIPTLDEWGNAGVDLAKAHLGIWTQAVELSPLTDGTQITGAAAEATITESAFDRAPVGQATDPDAPHVFISYSHEDRDHCDELKVALAPLTTDHGYKVWCDERISAGDYWEPAIGKALTAAPVVVMLATQRFIASAFIREKEVAPTLAAAKEHKKTVIWVKWEECEADGIGLGRIQLGHQFPPPVGEIERDEVRRKQLHKVYENVLKALQDMKIGPRNVKQRAVWG